MSKVEEATSALESLEGPKHLKAQTLTRHKLMQAHGSDEEKAEALSAHEESVAAHNAHVRANGGERAYSRKLDQAAQAVLDARGEGHTETAILPEGE